MNDSGHLGLFLFSLLGKGGIWGIGREYGQEVGSSDVEQVQSLRGTSTLDTEGLARIVAGGGGMNEEMAIPTARQLAPYFACGLPMSPFP